MSYNAMPDPDSIQWEETSGRKGSEVTTFTFDTRQPAIIRHVIGSLATHIEATDNPNVHYGYATKVEPDELWRERGNGGRPTDAGYVHTYNKIRKTVVAHFEAGDLYESRDSFIGVLRSMHTMAAGSGAYERLNPHKHLLWNNLHGEFRPNEMCGNRRVDDARLAAGIALQYGDPYGAENHFERGEPGTLRLYEFPLPGVPDYQSAYERISYDEDGMPRGFGRERSTYSFVYPSAAALPQYMAQIQKIGRNIEQTIKTGGSPTEVVDLIARQYQYGAHARPFAQINNSLFMELANAQLKLLGYRGMTHGDMDVVAQRLQPDTFAAYFADRVEGAQAYSQH